MKKIKYILPLLTVALLLFPGIYVKAATSKKELAAGTKNTALTLTLREYQSIDGEISVKSKTDGKEIQLQSVSVSTNDETKTAVCKTANGKVYIVSTGDPLTTTVTMNVNFSGDGSYTISLRGGCTDKEGKYEADGINEIIKVTVGTVESKEEDSSDKEETDKEEEKKEETEDKEEGKKEEAEDKEESKEETEDKEESKEETQTATSNSKTDKNTKVEKNTKTTREPVKVLEEGERVIEEFLEKADEELKKEEKAEKEKAVRNPKSLDDFFNYLRNFWFVFLILFIFLLICIYLLWKLLRKNRKNDYDGAPMVDYRIEDDD